MPQISVLICTYRRFDRLPLLLGDVAGQSLPPAEIVIVDNDAAGSARELVDSFTKTVSIPVRYDIQPKKNISLTRNRSVELASHEWLAFLDDDERIGENWLQTMFDTAQQYQSSGCTGPALYPVPDHAPSWIKKADHYGKPPRATGTPIAPNQGAIGNALIKASALDDIEGPFDEFFGLTGGEDADMISRLIAAGHTLVWCQEAPISELVDDSRLSLKWILLRAMRGGQNFATFWKRGRFGELRWYSRPMFVLDCMIKLSAGAVIGLLLLPFGLHRAVPWLRKSMANVGKLSALLGAGYREYDSPSS